MITHNRKQIVLLAATQSPQCTHVVDKHLDGYYTIQFMDSGGVWLAYDEREFRLEGLWFWPAYPGPRTRFNVASGYTHWSHRHIAFRGPLVERWIADGLWPSDPQPAPHLRDYSAFFDELIGLSKRTDQWGWLRAVNQLEQLLFELAEARDAPMVDDPWVETVIKAIQGKDGFTPDYARLADNLGIGLSTLRRRFRQSTGTPLHKWAMRERMAQAQSLLTDTDIPVTQVAETLGYNNIYFFSRQFHECCGVSPTAYRSSRMRPADDTA
jgi:AraC-like DNA-binding protein